jgi:probable rRNA maturation factor
MPARNAPPAARPVAVSVRHPRLRVPRGAVEALVAALDAHAGRLAPRGRTMPAGELSVAFLGDTELAGLHGRFLRDPSTTDVITFEGAPELGVAGEICVSADTALAYARSHGREFSAELALYVVHGWLHLAGHDDLQPAKKRAMRRAEARAMAILAKAGALPSFSLRRRQGG